MFLDADKDGYSGYLTQILKASQPGSTNRLVRPGALILADNVLRRGYVADESELSEEERKEAKWMHLEAVRKFNDQVVAEPRLESFLLPLWDGLTIARVID